MHSAKIGSGADMQGAIANEIVNMVFARIGGSLDIRGTTFATLNLSGASIAGDLRLGRLDQPVIPMLWLTEQAEPGRLILRNTTIANLSDMTNAWPQQGYLHLDGFSFARLGGYAEDMRARGMKDWDDWTRRDPNYTPTPYERLTAALLAAGDRDAADEMRYLGRVRQQESEKNWGSWISSGFLRYVAGFGIGQYTFAVLYWVIGITVLGGVYLWKCVPQASQHAPYGASVQPSTACCR